MTSKVSFPKLFVETLRRHMAAVLGTVLIFILQFIAFFLNVQNIIHDAPSYTGFADASAGTVLINLRQIAEPALTSAIPAALIAVMLSFELFRFLHSRKLTDFYASMPVKRGKLFVTLSITGVSAFAVIATVTTALEIALVTGMWHADYSVIQNLLWNLVCQVGAFVSVFALITLVMILTGHSIVAFLGAGACSVYVPLLLANLIPSYASEFLDTYIVSRKQNAVSTWFSPLTLIQSMAYDWSDWKISAHFKPMIGCFIFALVVMAISYFLFLIRPSEAAGRAMAFEKINPVIRIMLTIPLALYTGLFLKEMSYGSGVVWLIFGIVFGSFIIHGITECIFEFDIRAILRKKAQLLICVIASCGFAMIFILDLFRYDSYIPDANDVKTVFFDSYAFENDNMIQVSWKNNGLSGDNVSNAILAVKDIMNADYKDDTDDTNNHGTAYVYGSQHNIYEITVTYKLKNGMEKKRRYEFDMYNIPEGLNRLFASAEFKDDYSVFYHLDGMKTMSLEIDNGFEESDLILSDEDMDEFVKLYLKDFEPMTLKEYHDGASIFKLYVKGTKENDSEPFSYIYRLNAGFKNVLGFLKERGITPFYESGKITLKSFMEYDDNYTHEGMENEGNKDERLITVTDSRQLNALKPYFIPENFADRVYPDYVYGKMEYESAGSLNAVNVFIKKSDLDAVLNGR